jgi:hypothetical protein
VLLSTETAAMLFLALLASGQIMSARSAASSRSPHRPSITH